MLLIDRMLALQNYFHKNFHKRKQEGKFRCAKNTLNVPKE